MTFPGSHRILLIGPGRIGTIFARLATAAGDQVTGVVSSSLSSAEAHLHALLAKQEAAPDAKAFTSIEDALAATRFDGIVLSSPSHVRTDALRLLLPTGIPLLCEKPLLGLAPQSAQMETETLLLCRQYSDAPFIFNAGNHHFLSHLDLGASAGRAFHFHFHTNGPHRGLAIAEDLLPHCLSFIQKATGSAAVEPIEANISEHAVSGEFFCGNTHVLFDFAQGPDTLKDLTFGFEGQLYRRVQKGMGATYQVFMAGPLPSMQATVSAQTPLIECRDPFAVNYGRLRALMDGSTSVGDGRDMGWAVDNHAACCQLLRQCGHGR